MPRRAVLLALPAILLLLCVDSACAQNASLAFDWAFVKRAADGSPQPLDFSDKVSIATGDMFRIYIKPIQAAFVYVFLDDASDELSLLYPPAFNSFTAPDYVGAAVFIPDGTDWFALDGTSGTERFYLLASSTRLSTLETLVASLGKVADDAKSSASARAAARQAVLDEIARLRREHSSLAAAAEKPVTFAGGTRGSTTDIARKSTRIEAQGFYTRTFRLQH